jgi:virulence-associated protein VapD
MPDLSLQHIDLISRDIQREEILFSHLRDDLIDHVCCDVEHEMQNGMSFNEAYHNVKQKIGLRRFKEIQEETLYLVDSKYRNMKNLMKISGVAGTIMFGFAALFKIQHWPLAGIMMTLGALILAFAFLPSALTVLWKETHNPKRLFLFISAFFAGVFFIAGTVFKVQHWPLAGLFLTIAALFGILFFIPALALSRLQDQENKAKWPVYILGGAGSVLYVAGMFFKLQHWPLATVLSISGIIILCLVAFPMYTWITWKKANHISTEFIFMVLGFLLVIVPGTLINLNLQNSYNKWYYSHQDQQQALFDYRFNHNKSLLDQYHDSVFYPDIEQLHSRTTRLIGVVNNLQRKMIDAAEGKSDMTISGIVQAETGQKIQYDLLSRPFATGVVGDFLYPGCASRKEIDASLEEYLDYIAKINPVKDIIPLRNILNPAIYMPADLHQNKAISLMAGLHSLELLKNSILTVECYMLTNFTVKPSVLALKSK